jgi:phosphoribosylformylglycinamidine synthase
MRVTGAGNPLRPIRETITGKLPQRKLVTTAAAGYSSYGNQIGLATGQVDEWYHDGYVAKRMEIGAVIAAAPEKNVRREQPIPGDQIILLGGRTGRDGCGGATGSSKSHTLESLETCGAEVQKGNAPEERKLQRLLRNPEASLLIKRCNDFGAGGVSVAIGELADGLEIDLNAVPKKYEGLDGTSWRLRIAGAHGCRLAARTPFVYVSWRTRKSEATVVAQVPGNRGWPALERSTIVIFRGLFKFHGAPKLIDFAPEKPRAFARKSGTSTKHAGWGTINVSPRRGLSERLDSTIGAGRVMPFGATTSARPIQAMYTRFSGSGRHDHLFVHVLGL